MLRCLIVTAVLLNLSPAVHSLFRAKEDAEDANAASLLPTQLIENENKLLQIFDDHIVLEEQRLQKLKQIAEGVRKRVATNKGLRDNSQEMADMDETQRLQHYIGHPVNALHTIKTWKVFYEEGTEKTRNMANDLNRKLIDNRVRLPHNYAIKKRLGSILRLQRIYGLNTSDLVKGEIQGHKHEDSLNNTEILSEIGMLAFDQDEYALAVEWFVHALFAPEGTLAIDKVKQNIRRAASSLYDNILYNDITDWITSESKDIGKLRNILTEHRTRKPTVPGEEKIFIFESCNFPPANLSQLPDWLDLRPTYLKDTEADRLKLTGNNLVSKYLFSEKYYADSWPIHALEESDRFFISSFVEMMKSQNNVISPGPGKEERTFALQLAYSSAGDHLYNFVITDKSFRGQYGRMVEEEQTSAAVINIIIPISDTKAGGRLVFRNFEDINPLSLEKYTAISWIDYGGSDLEVMLCPTLLGETFFIHLKLWTWE